MEKSLKFFEPGERGIVKHVVGEGPVKRRLFDMGVTPGVEIVMKKLAPLGDPMEISLRGYELTLRKSEAEHIVMYVDGMHYRGGGATRRGRKIHSIELKNNLLGGRQENVDKDSSEMERFQKETGDKVINEDLYCRVGRRGKHNGHRHGQKRD